MRIHKPKRCCDPCGRPVTNSKQLPRPRTRSGDPIHEVNKSEAFPLKNVAMQGGDKPRSYEKQLDYPTVAATLAVAL